MGVLDWLKGAASTVGGAIGRGLEWVNKNVRDPVLAFGSKIPVVGDVIRAAEPLTKFGDKLTGAMQGKNSVGLSDLTNAVGSVPGVIAATRGAQSAGFGGIAQQALAPHIGSDAAAQVVGQGANILKRARAGIVA